ncbi:hypothetical protein N7478_010068 [Penicillium angulare]|uniref:uncharacterized protein n=1 Tax=Penicillium angulare TaxID=116970 RepID=UPI002540121C|nr:uncharacterized protein N7478_010068 [Penicillium angulare]KAJ5267260.1 hypothetical protein N7478_010068 [Penicillium angulare]
MVPSTRRNPASSRNSARSEPATPPPLIIGQPEVESVPDQHANPAESGPDQIGEIAGDLTTESISGPGSVTTDALEEKRHELGRLEEFLAIHTRLKELSAQVSGINAGAFLDNLSMARRGTEVKTRKKVEGFEVDKFKKSFSLQERANWLSQLGYVFRGNPGVYEDEEMKILAGVKYLDSDCKNDWTAEERYLEDNNDDRFGSWEYFKEWTLTLIYNKNTFTGEVSDEMERCRQRTDEEPKAFHHRLADLERHLPQVSRDEQARRYMSKLQPWLTLHIRQYAKVSPETRAQWVEEAQSTWEFTKAKTHKRNLFINDSNSSSKRPRPNDSFPNRSNGMERDQKGPGNLYSKGPHGPRPNPNHNNSKSYPNPPRFGGKPRPFSPRNENNPNNTPVGGTNLSNPSNPSTRTPSNSCFNCGKPGHWANECRLPPRAPGAKIQEARSRPWYHRNDTQSRDSGKAPGSN